MSLTITDRPDGDFLVVELEGDIDVESARDLRAHFVEALGDGTARVVVDLSGVGFMDSSGLGALVGGWHLTREEGEFRIAGAQPIVERVLSITGMEGVFAIYPDVAAATDA